MTPSRSPPPIGRCALAAAGGPGGAPDLLGLLGRVRARRRRAPGRTPRRHPLVRLRGAGQAAPGRHRRSERHLRHRRAHLDLGRRDHRDRHGAGDGRGRSRAAPPPTPSPRRWCSTSGARGSSRSSARRWWRRPPRPIRWARPSPGPARTWPGSTSTPSPAAPVSRCARCTAAASPTCNTTPARLIAKLRLEQARALLTTNGLPQKALAARCGFGNATRMRRAFERELGVTPRAYRVLHAPGGSS